MNPPALIPIVAKFDVFIPTPPVNALIIRFFSSLLSSRANDASIASLSAAGYGCKGASQYSIEHTTAEALCA
eukprot:14410712-Ditylum_brightwellii.AAC.1